MASRSGRTFLRVAAFAFLFTVVTASATHVDHTLALSEAKPDLPLPPPPTSEPEPAAERDVGPQGEPTRVVIPAIDVDADLVRLGLQADGAMEVPDFGLAGWYTEGPKPGHVGPAAITAHVDSRAGPDVFHRLGNLAVGDQVHVVYEGGDTVTFFVESSEQTPKDELPVDAIWPTTSQRLLALITCGGEFDRSVRHYRDNVVVYTSLRDPLGQDTARHSMT